MYRFLSIIIPVYNVENYLADCLGSIVKDAAVHSKEIEVIVVDDGATDNSGMIADEFAEQYPFIHVIHRENAGVASARNAGMKAAQGEWIYFMDSDDWLAEEGLTHIYQCIKRQEYADVILFDAYKNAGKTEIAWEHFDKETIWQSRELRAIQREVLYFHKTSMAAPWDKVYRRSFLDENHIVFRENLKVLDDMVFNVEVFGAAKEAAYYKNKIYHYRYVEESITNSYKPDRVEQDLKVWKYLEQYMAELFTGREWTESDRENFRQAYYCRVIKSFSICCRLCFFNRENKKHIGEKVIFLKEVLSFPAYREAFTNVRLHYAEWKLKIVILMGRLHMGYGIYLLHMAEAFARNKRIPVTGK